MLLEITGGAVKGILLDLGFFFNYLFCVCSRVYGGECIFTDYASWIIFIYNNFYFVGYL